MSLSVALALAWLHVVLLRVSDAVPFFCRVSFNGSPRVLFSGCGYHVPALACRARGVPSRPRQVQSCSTEDEHLLNVGSQTVPSPQGGGTERESKRGAASERTPLSLCDTSPRHGWVEHRGICQDEQSSQQKTGEPSPPSSPQETEGHKPKERWAPSPDPDGRQLKDWLSGTLHGTFLTQTCWTSPTACWRLLLGFKIFKLCLPRLRSGWLWRVVRLEFSMIFVVLASGTSRSTTPRRLSTR